MGIYKSKNIYIAMVLVLSIIVMAFSINRMMEKAVISNLSSSLGAILESTHEAVLGWSDNHVWQTRVIAGNKQFVDLTQRLKWLHDAGKDLSKVPEQAALRSLLSEHIIYQDYDDFFIITPEGINIASMRDDSLGTKNLIYDQKNKLGEMFRDKGGMTLPQLSDEPLINREGELVENYPIMFVGASVKDESGKAIATLAFRIDPTREFADILQRGRTGVSGETYAFDKNGLLLSESRFRKQLVDIGVLGPNQASMLAIKIRDPGIDLIANKVTDFNWKGRPLTEMVEAIRSKADGENWQGYADYRGVKVVGKWHWHDGMGFGVVIEVDYEEAYAMLKYGQKGLFAMAFVAGLLVIILAWYARRNEIRSELENNLLHLEKAKAEKASRAKSNFLSSMSHELRTPLNAILGFTQLLELDAEKNFDNNQKECVAQILKAGEHLLELIEQVLELNKIEVGKMGVSLETVDPLLAIEECISMVEVGAEERSIEIIDRIENHLPDICTDRTRFKQVIINLLSNAVKYNKKGGSVEITDEIVNDDMLRISISDTGEGIPENKKLVLFNPFERLGKEGGNIEGVGIGLAISQKIMEMLGGKIGYESKAGKGSCFWLEVPLCKAPRVEHNNLTSEKKIMNKVDRNSDKKILYVEDNPANLKLMMSALSRLDNVELYSANDAEQGLEIATSEAIDLVLMDINLPGMDGVEAMRRLRMNSETCHIPVIAVTANAMKSEIEAGQKAGFEDYLTKPLDIYKTMDVINDYLSKI